MEQNRQSNLSLSMLIMRLYGQSHYVKVKDYQSVDLVKKYYARILISIKYAISQTIEITDKHQIVDLYNIIKVGEQSLKTCKTFSDIDQTFITIQTKLIFQLIGQLPNNSQETKVINNKERWKLNPIRQIQYVQNSKQKEIAIFHLIQTKFLSRFGTWTDFVFFYFNECDNNVEKLIEYFKKNHLDIYMEI